MDLSNKENLLPQIVETKIIKKEQQESILRDAPESTSDGYKKAQAKMKQQILKVLLSTLKEKVQHTSNVAINFKREECTQILKWMHSETLVIMQKAL